MSMSSAQALGLLKSYLENRQIAGQTHLHLRPGTLEGLGRVKQKSTARVREVARLVEEQSTVKEEPLTPLPSIESVLAPEPEKTAASLVLDVPGATKAEKLANLAAMAEQSPEARALGTLRQTMVFAVGTPDAEILFIGEAPGSEEERQREPFVGPAGQKLTGILTAMGLKRETIYISNICKFRPAMENQGFSNRAPTPVEMKTCLPYIMTEIAIIQPKVMVALGATAATGLGLTGPVSKLRGKFYEVAGIPTMVTFHPSYILREEKLAGGGLQAKRQVWEDMLQVMEKASLPISEKQRGYFKK